MSKKQRNQPVIRFQVFLLICLLLPAVFFQAGCCNKELPIVVVREASLRFGPVALPLDPTGRDALKKYLRSGGDKRFNGPAPFYLKNKAFYSDLLALLARRDPPPRVEDFFARPDGLYKVTYDGFLEPVIYDVIDATRETPAMGGTLAVSDGNLWWIFHKGENDSLALLQVTVPVTNNINHYGSQ